MSTLHLYDTARRAVVPFEPVFALFVALYQLPMYFTPLLLGRLAIRPA